MKTLKQIGIGLFVATILAGCATNNQQPEQAGLVGFLGDYSNLESIKGDDGEEMRRWITSSNIRGLYPKLIVDPIVFYPEPQETEQVSVETLEGLRSYADKALRRELAKSYLLVNKVGPNTARIRMALTGVTTESEDMKAYEYTPFTAIAAGVSMAVGTRDRVTYIFLEAEVIDSLTEEKLGRVVRRVPGKKLLEDNEQMLTVEMVQEVFDEKARNARLIFDQVLK